MTESLSTAPPPASVRLLLTGRFGWFLAGRSVDLAGSSMTTTALALAVLQASGRAGDLGIVLAANLVPTLVLVLVGGAVADRTSRRTLLISANLASGTLVAALAVLLLSHHYSLTCVALLSFGTGIVGAFTSPALRGIVPELVGHDVLQRANALLATSQNSARILGPVLASILVSTAGGGWALAADALSFWLAALAFTRIPGTTRPPATPQPLWHDLLDGWTVFRSLRWVVVMTLSFALGNVLNVGPLNILGPQVVTARDGATGWGLIQAARAAGLLVMSLIAVRTVFRRPLRNGRIWGALAGLPLLALGLSGRAWAVAPAAFIGGLGFSLAAITWESTLQNSVPPESLSRVTAYDDLLSYLSIPLSQLAVGPLAGIYGAGRICTVCGIGYIAACMFPLLNTHIRTQKT